MWTGGVDGLETITGDLLIEGGIIKALGSMDASLLKQYKAYEAVDAKGAWVTPGYVLIWSLDAFEASAEVEAAIVRCLCVTRIIDIHSHLGVESSPSLSGANDGNSFKGTLSPWLRALDGLNTHDDGMKLAIAGGVTTSLILPGSANAIGESFSITQSSNH